MKITNIYIPVTDECVLMREQKRKKKIKWTPRAEALGVAVGGVLVAWSAYMIGLALWVFFG